MKKMMLLLTRVSSSMFSFLITFKQLKVLGINKLSAKCKAILAIEKSDADSHKITVYLANDYQWLR